MGGRALVQTLAAGPPHQLEALLTAVGVLLEMPDNLSNKLVLAKSVVHLARTEGGAGYILYRYDSPAVQLFLQQMAILLVPGETACRAEARGREYVFAKGQLYEHPHTAGTADNAKVRHQADPSVADEALSSLMRETPELEAALAANAAEFFRTCFEGERGDVLALALLRGVAPGKQESALSGVYWMFGVSEHKPAPVRTLALMLTGLTSASGPSRSMAPALACVEVLACWVPLKEGWDYLLAQKPRHDAIHHIVQRAQSLLAPGAPLPVLMRVMEAVRRIVSQPSGTQALQEMNALDLVALVRRLKDIALTVHEPGMAPVARFAGETATQFLGAGLGFDQQRAAYNAPSFSSALGGLF